MESTKIGRYLAATSYAIDDEPPDGFQVDPPFLVLWSDDDLFVLFPDEFEALAVILNRLAREEART